MTTKKPPRRKKARVKMWAVVDRDGKPVLWYIFSGQVSAWLEYRQRFHRTPESSGDRIVQLGEL